MCVKSDKDTCTFSKYPNNVNPLDSQSILNKSSILHFFSQQLPWTIHGTPAMLQQLMLESAMRPTLTVGIKKTKEIAQKAKKEIKKDPRDNLELAT